MTWPTMSDTFQAGHSVGACQSSPPTVSSSAMRSSYAPVATSAASVVWVMGVIWSIAVVMVVLFDEQFRRMHDELTNGGRVVADNPGCVRPAGAPCRSSGCGRPGCSARCRQAVQRLHCSFPPATGGARLIGAARFEGLLERADVEIARTRGRHLSLSIVMHRDLTKKACLHEGEAIGSKRSIAAPLHVVVLTSLV